MRIFERHKNGAVLDVDGEPDRAALILVQWRDYQDKVEGHTRVVGFVKEEN